MRREKKGISSIYGFIMIFLLSMASIQTWSSAVSSFGELQAASDQSRQIEQTQGLEHLYLSLANGNLTITNDGQIPSQLAYLRVFSSNDSTTAPLEALLTVGGSLQIPVSRSANAVDIITSLGNVFILDPQPADPAATAYWLGGTGGSGSPDLQVYQNPSDPSVFFLGAGSTVYAFGTNGDELWSFNPGQGSVTDILPLSNGEVYVSVGYGYESNSANLYELNAAGDEIASFSVRLDQISASGLQSPVSKGADSNYALYDGWFYGPYGPSYSVQSDGLPLAAADGSGFYFYQAYADGSTGSGCQGGGDEVKMSYVVPSAPSASAKWTDYFYLASCGAYPPQLLAATAGNGIAAALFSSVAYSVSELNPYSGSDPYLLVMNDAGMVLYGSALPSVSYSSSIVTDGAVVYLALPESQQIQLVNTTDGIATTYNIGFPASQLAWASGSLFAISSHEVRVYGPGMNLTKTISFTSLTLASFSNSFPQEQPLHGPSFIPINSTSYVALLENSTGYATMVIGKY